VQTGASLPGLLAIDDRDSVSVVVIIAPIDPVARITAAEIGCKRRVAPNDMLRATEERLQADKEEGEKNHDDPSGQYLATLLEMRKLLHVAFGVEFAHVSGGSIERAPRRGRRRASDGVMTLECVLHLEKCAPALGGMRRGDRLALRGGEGLNDEPEWNAGFGRHLVGSMSSTATRPVPTQIDAVAVVAAVIDRPDRDIETGTAGAGCHRQGDGGGKNERPLPYRSRRRCILRV
jgi:hypothetical protein